MADALAGLLEQIRGCQVCAAALALGPRPIVQAAATSRLLIVGQAPGAKVHASGVPWDDASGDRLRDWIGLSHNDFHDPAGVALMPIGFCYPGRGASADLPPRAECAPLWHDRLRAMLPDVRLTLLVGHHAIGRYLPVARRQTMTETVRGFADIAGGLFPLPHPSWRSTIWMRQNPWFERDLLPALRRRVAQARD